MVNFSVNESCEWPVSEKMLELINWALVDSTDCQHVADGGVSEALLKAD